MEGGRWYMRQCYPCNYFLGSYSCPISVNKSFYPSYGYIEGILQSYSPLPRILKNITEHEVGKEPNKLRERLSPVDVSLPGQLLKQWFCPCEPCRQIDALSTLNIGLHRNDIALLSLRSIIDPL